MVPIIMGIPAQDIIIGIPIAIMAIMALQRSRIISICPGSIGVMVVTMPSLVISHFMRQAMGIIMGMGIIIGMPI